MVHPSTTMNHSSDHWKRTPADTPLGLLLRESLKTHHRAGPFALSLPIYTCRIASDMDLDQPALDPSAQRETGKVFGEKQSRGIRSSGSPPLKERGGSRQADWENEDLPETFEKYEKRSISRSVTTNLNTLPIATVIEARGHDFVVSFAGQIRIAKLASRLITSGSLSRVVAGDDIRVSDFAGRLLRIDGVEPRRSVLGRLVGKTDDRTTFDPIAANIDLAILVCTPMSPPFRAGLIDRYFTAAALEGLPFAICLNKTDLGVTAEVEIMLEGYSSIGVTVFMTSAKSSEGIDLLKKGLERKISLLTGHSGVGKSTLLNAIEPGLNLKTGTVTEALAGDGKGRHTTTSARLIPLSSPGTYVVDSPGIRQFGLGAMSADDLLVGFPEIVEQGQNCRIRHCRHQGETGCSVETELSKTAFGAHRLSSYRTLSGYAPAVAPPD